jgi:glycosyltransferase involved in cell wall biosynthesis
LTAALAIPDRVIVHTPQGQEALVAAGLDPAKIAIVPHGRLRGATPAQSHGTRRGRWRIVQFGKVQTYKGVDILIEALGRLNPAIRARISVIVAGEPLIDVARLRARAHALGLDEAVLEFRFRRQSEAEMEALLAEADMFVFPYRAIEASGVLFLVAGRGKWIVASDLGAFSGLIGHDGQAGTLTPPADPIALAAAIEASIGRRPSRDIAAGITGWDRIGAMTRDVYLEARDAWRLARRAA